MNYYVSIVLFGAGDDLIGIIPWVSVIPRMFVGRLQWQSSQIYLARQWRSNKQKSIAWPFGLSISTGRLAQQALIPGSGPLQLSPVCWSGLCGFLTWHWKRIWIVGVKNPEVHKHGSWFMRFTFSRIYVNPINHEPCVGFQFTKLFWNPYIISKPSYQITLWLDAYLKKYFWFLVQKRICKNGQYRVFLSKLGSKYFHQMACIYLRNNRGMVRTFNFDITHF